MRLRVLACAVLALFAFCGISRFAPSAQGDVTTTWQGQYYANATLSGSPSLTRTDAAIDFDWAAGSPDPLVPFDLFSARWTGDITVAAGTYRFTATTDDGVRVYIDGGGAVIDQWTEHVATAYHADVNLTAGSHHIVMEYYDQYDVASAQLVITVAPISVNVTTNQPGLKVVVDGVAHDAPYALAAVSGTSHSVYAPSPQTTSDGRTVVFSGWSDGGAQSHTISPVADGTVTANFANAAVPPQIFVNGFEEGDLSPYVNLDIRAGNALGVSTTHARNGTYSLETRTGGTTQTAVVDQLFAKKNTVYLRSFISLPAGYTLEPGAVHNAMVLKTDDFRNSLWVVIGPDYRLSPVFFNAAGVPTFPGPFGPVLPRDGSFHEVQVRDTVDAVHGQVELWLDGTRIASFAEVNTGAAGTDDVGVVSWGSYFSTITNNHTIFFDDVAIATTYIPTVAANPTGLWQANYFNNTTLTGPPAFSQIETEIAHDWASGSPNPAIQADDFSARWTRTIQALPGAYRFTTTTDEGVRLYLDGDAIIDQWVDQPATAWSAVRTLTQGPHTLVMEYYEHLGPASASLAMTDVNENFSGFQTDVVAGGLFLPTHAAYTPDGRFLIAEKGGDIRVVKNGQLLETPLVTIPNVNTYQDRGLLAIAVDPLFAQNGYVYVAYTHDVNPADFTGPKTARLIRLTVVGDTASLATQVVLLGTEVGDALHPSCDDFPIGADCMPSDGRTHTIGDVQFRPDGTLLVTMGEGAPDETVNDQALRAQNLDSLGGKMLRINRDGTAPANNPFYNGNPSANRSKVWAYGFRNSFRFGIRPLTGLPYAGDVGWGMWEEVNVVRPGANYGWPCYEGLEYVIGYSVYPECEALNLAGTATQPLHYYPHPPSSAAVGGAFYEGTDYPAQYQGAYFFGDYARNNISTLRTDTNDALVAGSVTSLTNAADGPVQIFSGPEGDIYYVSINTGELRRIRYVQGDRPPVAEASANPTAGHLNLTVDFTSAGTADPENEPMTFRWIFGDGAESTAANPTHTYTTAGVYDVVLQAKDDHGLIGTASVQITAGNAPPVAEIDLPLLGTTYDVGQVISYSGHAADDEDGPLGDEQLSWTMILHHCEIVTSTCHTHPFLSSSGASGSFVMPDHGQGVSLELQLTAYDSIGLSDTKSMMIEANQIPLTVTSSPPGLTVALDGTNYVTPAVVDVAVNSGHVIFAPSPQTLAGGPALEFVSWSDLGAQNHAFLAFGAATLNVTFEDPLATPTATVTSTATATSTATHTPTPTSTATETSTPTGTNTATATATRTNTPTATNTATSTATATSTSTPTATSTPVTPTATNTATSTATATNTATATATSTNTPTATSTPITPTATNTATSTATATNTATPTHTNTPTATSTPTASATSTPTATGTPATPTVTATGTNTVTATATATATASPTPTPPDTPTLTATSTTTATPTRTATPTPSATATPGAIDSDGDGYPDTLELSLGENPNLYCGIMRADVDGDRVVSTLDLATVALWFIQSVPPAPQRVDQGPVFDNAISILDMAAMSGYFLMHAQDCTD